MRTERRIKVPALHNWLLLGAIALLHLACLVQVGLARRGWLFPEPWLSYLVPVLLVSLLLSAINTLSDLPWQMRPVMLLFKTIAAYILVVPVRYYPWIALTLFFALCLEFFLVFSFPAAVSISLISILLYELTPPVDLVWGQPSPELREHDAFMSLGYSLLLLSLIAGTRVVWNRYQDARKQLGQQALMIQNMSRANTDFQEYAVTLERESMELERKRITREIHDSMGYALTSLRLLLEAGEILLEKDPQELGRLMRSARGQLEDTQQDVRQSLRELRKVEDRKFSVQKRIGILTRNFGRATGVHIQLETTNLRSRLPRDIEDILYRAVQEGMTNAFLHGRARKIEIILHRAPESVNLAIIDDGVGSKQSEEGIGIGGMRERLLPLGGSLRVTSLQPGFELSLSIPYVEGQDED